MPYKCDTDTHIFFYEQEWYCLSNFSAFRLLWCELDFDTAEAAYQWTKFHHAPGTYTPRHRDIQRAIRQARSAHEAYKIAEGNRGHARHDWSQIRVAVMREILSHKVTQHEYVHRKLLETGTRELVEDSWRDGFWGWGADQSGHNMLGKLWMELRERLRTPQ